MGAAPTHFLPGALCLVRPRPAPAPPPPAPPPGAPRPYLLAHKDQIVDIACDSIADGSRVDTPELMALYGLSVPEQRVPA